MKRLLIAAGGTGGHLFPAQAVGESLLGSCDLLFAGSGLGKSPYFDQTRFPYREIAAAPLPLHPLRFGKGCLKLMQGTLQSLSLLKAYQPDLILGFGSFYTVPLLLAALHHRIPFLLHEQNLLPGRVNRLFSRWARSTAITFPESASLLRGATQHVLFPLRSSCRKGLLSPESARAHFALDPLLPTLLVFGGSQGAKKLNSLIMSALEFFSPQTLQVIHLTGEAESCREIAERYRVLGFRHSVKPFESCMGRAWSAATVVLMRAGASSIAEAMEFEVPALLVPYPNARDGHQVKNGMHLVGLGGGSLLEEREATAERVARELGRLLASEEVRRNLRLHKERASWKKMESWVQEVLYE